jgi:hypothetical protein
MARSASSRRSRRAHEKLPSGQNARLRDGGKVPRLRATGPRQFPLRPYSSLLLHEDYREPPAAEPSVDIDNAGCQPRRGRSCPDSRARCDSGDRQGKVIFPLFATDARLARLVLHTSREGGKNHGYYPHSPRVALSVRGRRLLLDTQARVISGSALVHTTVEEES